MNADYLAIGHERRDGVERDTIVTVVERRHDDNAVRAVLARYKSSIERLDASGTEALFTEDSAVFETGGVEGTYKEYLAHHLGPELAAFRSFAFSDYAVAARIEGDLALATETYNYRIETKSGEIAMRRGVATSVLTRTMCE